MSVTFSNGISGQFWSRFLLNCPYGLEESRPTYFGTILALVLRDCETDQRTFPLHFMVFHNLSTGAGGALMLNSQQGLPTMDLKGLPCVTRRIFALLTYA